MPTYNGVSSSAINGSYEDSSSTSTRTEKIAYETRNTVTSGTGESQSDLVHNRRYQHTSTATYDLTGGLTDAYGNALTYVTVRQILVVNLSTTSGELLVLQGNAMAAFLNGTTPTADLGPKGVFNMESWIDGFTITATTQDQLTIDAGANTISYDLFIIGASA